MGNKRSSIRDELREGVTADEPSKHLTALTPLHCLWRPCRKPIGWDVKICQDGSCRTLLYAPFKETQGKTPITLNADNATLSVLVNGIQSQTI